MRTATLMAAAFCAFCATAGASVFDDVKVWYKGSAGNEVGTADSGGASGWSGNICKLKSQPTLGTGGAASDGGQYFWWGYRIQYQNEHVKLPFGNLDIGESPCFVFPGLDCAGSNKEQEKVKVVIDGKEVERPVMYYKCGGMTLPNWLPDWPKDAVCSNYTCVMRFKPNHAINPVSGNPMTLAGFGSSWVSGDNPGGVSLSLNTLYTLDDHLSIRMFVGNQQFNYDPREKNPGRRIYIKEGSWVDFALIVASPKLTMLVCYEDEGTNAFRTITETFAAGSAKPSFKVAGNPFRLGSSGNGVYGCTYTNGVFCEQSVFRGDFWGAFHQVAFWDRTLSIDEAKEAMGGPALVSVGMEGNAGNGEFMSKQTTVAAAGAWERLDPVLTAANPSATITFPCSTQWAGLPQFLRIAACADSDAGAVEAAINGRTVGRVELTPGAAGLLHVGDGVIAEGENTLTLTRAAGATLKLDAVTLSGSWQYGLDVASEGIGLFGRDTETAESYDFNPACGDDKFHIRGLASNGVKNRIAYCVNVPKELGGWCRGRFHIRAQNTQQNTYTNDVFVNDVKLTRLIVTAPDVFDISVPAAMLKAGRNEIRLQQVNGWVNFDCHRFKLYPSSHFFTIIR